MVHSTTPQLVLVTVQAKRSVLVTIQIINIPLLRNFVTYRLSSVYRFFVQTNFEVDKLSNEVQSTFNHLVCDNSSYSDISPLKVYLEAIRCFMQLCHLCLYFLTGYFVQQDLRWTIQDLRWTNFHSGLILSISSSIGCHSWGAQWLSSREQSARRAVYVEV